MTLVELIDSFNLPQIAYFIGSSELQDYLFPVKLIFLVFTAFFFCAVIYLMVNSTWLQSKFLEETSEFLAWQSYGARQIAKQWNRIKRRMESGFESEFKLAIIEADDFLQVVLEDGGYEGETFEESVKKATRLLGAQVSDILAAHEVRNAIVYNPDYPLPVEEAKRIVGVYELAVNTVGIQ